LTKNIKFTQKKYTDSNIFNNEQTRWLRKDPTFKNQTNRIGTEKTDEYFELDEDFEIGKIDIKYQSVVNKNNII
jgi:hypothetical protein